EFLALVLGGEAHDPFHARPVVPGTDEQDDFPGGRQVRYVPLEGPLGPLALGRLLQRDHAAAARIEMLGEPLDRTALARGVAALEEDDDPLPGVLHPALQLDQLDLQA